MVRKGFELRTYFVNFGFDTGAKSYRQFKEDRVEARVSTFGSRRSPAVRLTDTRWVPISHIALGLLDRGLEFRGKFEFVLNQLIEPYPDLAQLSLGKLSQLSFHFFDLAHQRMMQPASCKFKPNPRVLTPCIRCLPASLSCSALRTGSVAGHPRNP